MGRPRVQVLRGGGGGRCLLLIMVLLVILGGQHHAQALGRREAQPLASPLERQKRQDLDNHPTADLAHNLAEDDLVRGQPAQPTVAVLTNNVAEDDLVRARPKRPGRHKKPRPPKGKLPPITGIPYQQLTYKKIHKSAPILNIQHDFTFPQVEAFSFQGSEEGPLIQDGLGHNFDSRGFSQRSEEGRERLAEPVGCGGTFTDLSGILHSPDYPFNYPNNIHCVYHISVDPQYTIGLDCSDFSIQPGDKQCENDYLGVSYDGDIDPEYMDKYCGDKSVGLFSHSNNLTLVFSTNNDYRYRGFMCRYRALNADGTGVEGTVDTGNNTLVDHQVICTGPGDSGWAGQCGVSHAYSRIVGGHVTEQHAFPWMVAVLKECGKNLEHYCHICGGTVIHTQWILTGAHCVISVPVERLGLLLGDHNLYTLTPSQKFFRVEASYVHPDFNVPSPLNNDVALLKLPQDMAFSSYIAPVCLPPRSAVDFLNLLPRVYIEDAEATTAWWTGGTGTWSTTPGTGRKKRQATVPAGTTTEVPLAHQLIHKNMNGRNISVYGWGTINDDGDVAQQLRQVTVEVLENDECDYYYGVMTDTMMCTSGEGGHGPCQGDSGSPAQLKTVEGRWLQVGVLAFGAAYGCEVGYPSGNVMLPFYMDWIEFVTGFNFQEYYQ